MLKIKDNVDLEQIQKHYGFKKEFIGRNDADLVLTKYRRKNNCNIALIRIRIPSRYLTITSYKASQELLFDLIKDGLVEKVVD